MVWKKREPELTAEQTLDLAKKETVPYWRGSSPLFIASRRGLEYEIFPLDPEFSNKKWLLSFVDPFDLGAAGVISYSDEWYRRFHAYKIQSLLILRPRHPSLVKNFSLDAFLQQHGTLHYPVVLDDQDGDAALARGFSVAGSPSAVLISDGKIQSSHSGAPQFPST